MSLKLKYVEKNLCYRNLANKKLFQRLSRRLEAAETNVTLVFSHLSPKMPRTLDGLGLSLPPEEDLDLDLDKRLATGDRDLDLDRLDDLRPRRAGEGDLDRDMTGSPARIKRM